jgi:hypothetical protein
LIYLNASYVPAILKEGMMVGVRIGPDSQWHGNIIYGVTGSVIRIAYMDKFVKQYAQPECPVWNKYSNDYFIYYFYGKVKKISSDSPLYILVKLENAEEMINNRLYPRYDVRIEATLRPVWDDEAYKCTITDLSYGGAAFECEHRFDSKENIEMMIHLPGCEPAKVTGKVIRRRSSGGIIADHAAQFIECDNISNRQLSDYFEKLENEVSKIYNQYMENTDE